MASSLRQTVFHWIIALGVVQLAETGGFSQTVRTAVGPAAADITAALDAFRADLGVVNNGPCTGVCIPGVGRREINWDGVPDATSSPNAFPGDFFNQATGGRARGVVFSTAGTFEVSADSDSDNDGAPGPVLPLFGNRHPDNDDDFAAFSPERIFGMIGATEMDVTFRVAGQPAVSALVRGFGAVFSDVELDGAVKLQYYDANDLLIHAQDVPFHPVPAGAGDTGKSFSFAGVSFDTPRVARVRIINGGFDLNLVQTGPNDASAMDDFIYGEPVPEPGSFVLLLAGAAILDRIIRSA